jgi:hypothetical protein
VNTDYRPHLVPGCYWLDLAAHRLRALFVRQTCPDCPHHRKALP